MTYRLPALFLALISIALLGGCHTAKSLIPDTLIPPNLRPPAANSGDALKLAQKKLQDAFPTRPSCRGSRRSSCSAATPWWPT
jgi:maltose operon protein